MLEQGHQTSFNGTGRALVALSRPGDRPIQDERPRAAFVAQLFACEHRFPAYRQARRADPNEAASEYDRERRVDVAVLDRTV